MFGTNIAFIFMKVDSHFYGVGYTSIFRVFKVFSLLIFYMGFYILIWGFSWGISGVFKKISVGALHTIQQMVSFFQTRKHRRTRRFLNQDASCSVSTL